MTMEIRKASKHDLQAIKAIYDGAFPIEERRPWDDFEQRATDSDPFFNVDVVLDSDRVAGFISTWRLPMALYVEHFAIDPSIRGKGVGGMLLDHIIAGARHPVLLEVEVPDESTRPEMARRRIDFYRRHGLETIDGIDYVQPPYARNLPEVPMLLMSTAPIADIEWGVRILHQIVYNQ